MSSRVLRPDDQRPVESLSLRQVRAAGGGTSTAAPVVEEPPPSQQMQQEIEQRVRDARAQGNREGEAAGRAQAAAEVRPVIERLSRSVDEIAGFRGRLRREAEADTI